MLLSSSNFVPRRRSRFPSGENAYTYILLKHTGKYKIK